MGRYRRIRYVFLIPIVVYIAVMFLYPIAYNIQISFQNLSITNFSTGAAAYVGLSNYTDLLQNDVFWQSVRDAVIFTIGSVAVQFLIGGVIALLLRKPTRLALVARPLMLFPWLLPFVAVATVFVWFFDGDNGIVNWALTGLHMAKSSIFWLALPDLALVVVIIANIWIGIPFNYALLHSGLQALPDEMREAAAIDGANGWQELVHITIPLMRDTILAVIILGIIGTMKVFDLVWIMTKGGPVNATQLLATFSYQQSFIQFQFGSGAAVVMLMVLVLMVFAALYVWVSRRSQVALTA